MSTDQTPALDRAAEEYRKHRLAVPEMVCEGCGFVVATNESGELDHDAWLAHRIAAVVAAALHDPNDDVIARTLREHGIRGSSGTGPEPWTSSCWAPGCDWRGDSSSHPAHQADAVRAALLGGDA